MLYNFLTAYLHPPKQKIPRRIRARETANLNLWISHSTLILILDVIIKQQPSEEHLNLIRSKEATGVRMLAIAKTNVLFVSRHEPVAHVIGGNARLTQFVVSEPVEAPAGLELRGKLESSM